MNVFDPNEGGHSCAEHVLICNANPSSLALKSYSLLASPQSALADIMCVPKAKLALSSPLESVLPTLTPSTNTSAPGRFRSHASETKIMNVFDPPRSHPPDNPIDFLDGSIIIVNIPEVDVTYRGSLHVIHPSQVQTLPLYIQSLSSTIVQ
jgi:hypothetical protein